MRISELPAISLHARPIQLGGGHRLLGRTLGAAGFRAALDPDHRPPGAGSALVPGLRRLGTVRD